MSLTALGTFRAFSLNIGLRSVAITLTLLLLLLFGVIFFVTLLVNDLEGHSFELLLGGETITLRFDGLLILQGAILLAAFATLALLALLPTLNTGVSDEEEQMGGHIAAKEAHEGDVIGHLVLAEQNIRPREAQDSVHQC